MDLSALKMHETQISDYTQGLYDFDIKWLIDVLIIT